VGEEKDCEPWSSATRGHALRLEQEAGNLHAALHWGTSPPPLPAADPAERAVVALRLAGALGGFWYFRGHFREAQHWFRETLARAGDDAPPLARARVLMNSGRIAWQQGEYAAAHSLLEEGLKLAREIDHHDLIVQCLMNLGQVKRYQRRWGEAHALYSTCIDLCRATRDHWGWGVSLGLLGVSERLQGNLESARALLHKGVRILRRAGDPGSGIFLLVGLAELEETLGNEARAVALYRESLRLCQETGYRLTTNRAVAALARTLAGAGWTPFTVRLFSAGIARAEALGLVNDPETRADHERAKAAARNTIGATAFAAAWAEGQQMPFDQAVAEVLQATAGLGAKGDTP
jgi:tetratricopeptide (TPR) repeat protein